MTTLVTGANGFVGSHVSRLLVARGDRVRAFVRPDSRLTAIDGLPVEICRGDLRDPKSIAAALHGVRRIFHVAADYRLWARDPRTIYDTNVVGTRNLLDACRRVDLDRLVYTSSVATIVGAHGSPLPDESARRSIDEMIGHYKRSKFIAEQEALAAARDGLPVIVVNPTTPVGAGDWKPTPTGRMIVDFLRGRMFAYVETGLNLVSVHDVAAGHLAAAERGRTGERYILGGRNMRLKEIFDVLAAITGRPAPRLRLPHAVAMAIGAGSEVGARVLRREPVVPLESVRMARHYMLVSSTKAARELGFAAGSIEAALEEAVRWYIDRGYAPEPRRRVSPPPTVPQQTA
jgi:dihydroflavonol-4-reductase